MKLMRLLLVSSVVLLVVVSFAFARQKHSMNAGKSKTTVSPLHEARQLMLVITPDWNAVDGTLRRYQRRNVNDAWQPVAEAVSIVVGRKGMAWGIGLHKAIAGKAPVKKEGDGKSPAGIFSLGSAFGYAEKNQAGELKLPYTFLSGSIECVDDVKSSRYNTIVDRKQIAAPDWNSSEKMREQKDYYRWGVVVDHNAAPVKAGCGSCIFLHIWGGAGSGTAGCTAMEADQMETLMRWLDPSAKPMLVQLPEAEYQRLKAKWKLPEK